MRWILAAALFLGTATAANAQTASADLRTGDGQTLATATFTQARDEVLISIAFAHRTALIGTHAIQIHSEAQCSAPGSILNPSQRQHGLQNPNGPMAGDLPNLVIGPAGVNVYNLSAPLLTISILAANTTSLVIFAQADDGTSQPEGNAGQRIACGLIHVSQAPSALSSSVLIGLVGGLLFAGGVVLRRAP